MKVRLHNKWAQFWISFYNFHIRCLLHNHYMNILQVVVEVVEEAVVPGQILLKQKIHFLQRILKNNFLASWCYSKTENVAYQGNSIVSFTFFYSRKKKEDRQWKNYDLRRHHQNIRNLNVTIKSTLLINLFEQLTKQEMIWRLIYFFGIIRFHCQLLHVIRYAP